MYKLLLQGFQFCTTTNIKLLRVSVKLMVIYGGMSYYSHLIELFYENARLDETNK